MLEKRLLFLLLALACCVAKTSSSNRGLCMLSYNRLRAAKAGSALVDDSRAWRGDDDDDDDEEEECDEGFDESCDDDVEEDIDEEARSEALLQARSARKPEDSLWSEVASGLSSPVMIKGGIFNYRGQIVILEQRGMFQLDAESSQWHKKADSAFGKYGSGKALVLEINGTERLFAYRESNLRLYEDEEQQWRALEDKPGERGHLEWGMNGRLYVKDKDREIWSYNASVPRIHPVEDFALSLEHRCVSNGTGPSFAGYTSTGHKSKGGSRLVQMDDPIGYLNDKCSGAFGATARAALASEVVAGIECLPETPWGPPRAWGAGEGAVVVCDSKANCTSETNVWAMSVNYRDHDTWPTEEGEFRSCNNWCDQVICIKTEAGNSSEEGPQKLDADEALLELSDASMPVLKFDLAPFSFAPMAVLKLKLQLLPKHQPRNGIAATAVQLREHDCNAEGGYGKNGTILGTLDFKKGTRGGKSLWYKFNVSAAVQSKIPQSSLCLTLTTNVSLPFGSYFTVAATESALNDRPYLVLGKPWMHVVGPRRAITTHHVKVLVDSKDRLYLNKREGSRGPKVPGNVMLLYDESKDDFVDISHNIDIRNMLGQCCGPMGETVVDPNGTIYGSTEWGIWQLDAADNFTWNKIDYYWGNAKLKWLGQHLFHQPRGNKFIRQNVETLRRHEIAPPTFGNSTELHLSGAVLMEGGERLVTFVRENRRRRGDPTRRRRRNEGTIMTMTKDISSLPPKDRNLQASLATYLPEEGEAVGAAFTSDGKMIVAGTFGSVGKLLLMNESGVQTEYSLGNETVYDLDAMSNESSLVVSGSFGVKRMDVSATNFSEVWSWTPADLSGEVRVSTAAGKTAALYQKTVAVLDDTGTMVSSDTIPRDYPKDVAISPDGTKVYAVGFRNGRNEDDGSGRSNPVQLAFVYAFNAANLSDPWLWKTFDFDPNLVDWDMADTRLYRVAFGQDRQLYILGETAGGNSIFRWDGKHCQSKEDDPEKGAINNVTLLESQYRRLKYTDIFDHGFNAGSAHMAYFARIDPTDGAVKEGKLIIPRLISNMKSNTFRVKEGSITADSFGRVYVGGVSSCCIEARDLNFINRMPVGSYAGGDMALVVVSPDLQSRLRWTPFSKEKGKGSVRALAVRPGDDGVEALLLGSVHHGEMHTVNAVKSSRNMSNTTVDGYLVRWQEEALELGVSEN